jgi:endonuclease III
MVCGGGHPKEVCKSTKPKCANCGGEHKANSNLCHKIKAANKIEEVRAKNG